MSYHYIQPKEILVLRGVSTCLYICTLSMPVSREGRAWTVAWAVLWNLKVQTARFNIQRFVVLISIS